MAEKKIPTEIDGIQLFAVHAVGITIRFLLRFSAVGPTTVLDKKLLSRWYISIENTVLYTELQLLGVGWDAGLSI